MLLLVAGSGFFSGAETAFFNLSGKQIAEMAGSKHKNRTLAANLLKRPKRLLTTLLMGNMAVNILYFAISSTMAVRLSDYSHAAAVAIAVLAFALLVMFGEMLPKSFSYSNSVRVSIIAAVPTVVCVYIFTPFRVVLNKFVVSGILRLFRPESKKPRPLSAHQFKVLIESSRQKGLISSDENQFLSAVIDMSILKVRHIMRPRVDMLLCRSDKRVSKDDVFNNSHGRRDVFLYEGEIDNIVSIVTARKILLSGDAELKDIAEQVRFVPEQKSVESLLESFLEESYKTAVVVDEYGQTAGAVYLDDIVDYVIGSETGDIQGEHVEQIGPMEYRLAGNTSIHQWAENFGLDHRDLRFSTVAGLTGALLGKVAKAGDSACLQNVKFTVEKVNKHRIESIILLFEPVGEDITA